MNWKYLSAYQWGAILAQRWHGGSLNGIGRVVACDRESVERDGSRHMELLETAIDTECEARRLAALILADVKLGEGEDMRNSVGVQWQQWPPVFPQPWEFSA